MSKYTWPLTDSVGYETDIARDIVGMKIEPCRFCGSKKSLYLCEESSRHAPALFQVFCRSCKASGSEVRNPATAVRIWNEGKGRSPTFVLK